MHYVCFPQNYRANPQETSDIKQKRNVYEYHQHRWRLDKRENNKRIIYFNVFLSSTGYEWKKPN
jgi:hypothetical protein